MARMPIKRAARTFLTSRATIRMRPTSASTVVGLRMLPRPTSVLGSATTRPALRKPMRAMKRPMPLATAAYSSWGMARRIICRMPAAVMARKMTPERKTAPRAVCQGMCILMQTA
jgi:hypothetical protein